MSEWVAESRPVPEGLEDTTVHADYTPTPFGDRMLQVPIEDRIEAATVQQLRELANGGCGNVP